MSKKKFRWEKWIDPLNGNMDEVEWPGAQPDADEEGEYPIDLLDITDSDMAVIRPSWDDEPIHAVTPIKVAHTKLGMLTLTEYAMASSQFNFYNLHTNFKIGHEEACVIEDAVGVETIEIVSPYRVRIGFPKTTFPKYEDSMWDLSALKKGIEDDLMALDGPQVSNDLGLDGLFTEPLRGLVEEAQSMMADSRYWAILVLPNGAIETLASERKDTKFNNRLNVLKACEAKAGGVLLTSEV